MLRSSFFHVGLKGICIYLACKSAVPAICSFISCEKGLFLLWFFCAQPQASCCFSVQCTWFIKMSDNVCGINLSA